MRVLVAGGKLQGVEAAYLARQAGWNVLLIDRYGSPPARGLAHQFRQLDLLEDPVGLAAAVAAVDFIIPAIEDETVLALLEQAAQRAGTPIACDLPSYALASSKKRSDRLFAEKGIPAPRGWPDCGFPVIVKHAAMSGSQGVRKIPDQRALDLFFEEVGPAKEDYVVQEYLEGAAYSIEIVGRPGSYEPLQVTELHFDPAYDCKRVLAPAALAPEQVRQFRELSVQIAELVLLTGLMDVEVIDDRGTLKVLEIDARLPSQTPTAVYRSSGVNMLELLYNLFAGKQGGAERDPAGLQAVVYEHIRVTPDRIETLGERIIAAAGPLKYHRDFFGADEALTDYRPGCRSWSATLIITENDRARAWEKRCRVLENIRSR